MRANHTRRKLAGVPSSLQRCSAVLRARMLWSCTNTHAHTSTFIYYVLVHTSTCVHTSTQHAPTCVRTYILVYPLAHTCTYIGAYVRTYMHTYIYMHARMLAMHSVLLYSLCTNVNRTHVCMYTCLAASITGSVFVAILSTSPSSSLSICAGPPPSLSC